MRTSLLRRSGASDIEHDARFFTSVSGVDRVKMFAGPSEDDVAEREDVAERARTRVVDPDEPDAGERRGPSS